MKNAYKRILSGSLAAVMTFSSIVTNGIESVFAAEKNLDDLAVSLNLSIMSDDVIGLDFYAKLEDTESPKLEYRKGSSEWSAEALEWDEKTESFKGTVEIPASDMTDEYEFQFYSGDKETGRAFTYSVAEYAEQMLHADKLSDKERDLIVSMLNYGAMAQVYLDRKSVV